MERKSAIRSISNGVNQILGQYNARETINDNTIDEIIIRLNAMLDRSWTHGDIIGWTSSWVEVTNGAITATVNYTINQGDKSLHPNYCVLRMSQERRDELRERIAALAVEVNSIVPITKHESAFDRAMNGV